MDVVSAGGGVRARSDRLLELADSGQYEGILSLAPVLPEVERKLHQRTAVVISADFDDEMRGIGQLADATPVVRMIEHLASLGHSRFLHVAGDAQFASARARKQSYLDTVERLGVESVGVFDGDWSGESGIEAIRSLPSHSRPTAVIAANDLVAAGVVRGARERGWDVPGDLSVTGWDNAGVGQFMTPSLTTVDVELEQLGSTAMAKLIAGLRNSAPEAKDEPLLRIIWRESTGEPPATRPSQPQAVTNAGAAGTGAGPRPLSVPWRCCRPGRLQARAGPAAYAAGPQARTGISSGRRRADRTFRTSRGQRAVRTSRWHPRDGGTLPAPASRAAPRWPWRRPRHLGRHRSRHSAMRGRTSAAAARWNAARACGPSASRSAR